MVPPALARRLLVGVILLTTASACTGSDDSAAEVAAATVTPTVAPTATAVAPTPEPTAISEPTPTPTLEPTPEPTLDPVARAQADIELIKTVHTRFMTELLVRDERDPRGVAEYLALAGELTAGEQLERIRSALAERQANEQFTVTEAMSSHIEGVEVWTDGTVEIRDCSLVTGSILDARGHGEAAPNDHEWRATYLRLQEDGFWRVVAFDSEIDTPCSPPT